MEKPKGIGMRGIDLQKFLMVARHHDVIILVRPTNEAALKYIGKPGFYPKPMICKAKTAHDNPEPIGATTRRRYEIAGLVVHPGFHPTVYAGEKLRKYQSYWDKTMEVLSPTMKHRAIDPYSQQSRAPWGVDRVGVGAASRWSWRVDINPDSERFGCIQLKKPGIDWSYIHGDYDLKDVIAGGEENGRYTDNRSWTSLQDGVANSTPLLKDRRYSSIQAHLNLLIGAEMVQHGAEAQFSWHGDDPIMVIYPEGKHMLLYDAMTVQSIYSAWGRKMPVDPRAMSPEEARRKGLTDFHRLRSEIFTVGPDGTARKG
jgi:hypothetical protein